MVKYKTNDIIKNINECVNLINSATVQKNFLVDFEEIQKRRIAAVETAAIRL